MSDAISLEERLAYIQLNATTLSFSQFLALKEKFGSAVVILKQTPETLADVLSIPLANAHLFIKQAHTINAKAELEKTEKIGGHIYVPLDDEYPKDFLTLKDAPLAIYVLGNLPFKNKVLIGFVGTRKVTPYGKRVAKKLATDIVKSGAIIVSGLARGVDSIGHLAAVDAQAPTIAFIGTGIGRCYPPENATLAKNIVNCGGAIISEFPFDSAPLAYHFPKRNRLIATLSNTTVVIEGEIKSGALITAKLALEMGKDVLAVPGPIDSPFSEGPNALIKQGAGMLTSYQDLFDSLPMHDKNLLSPIGCASVSSIKNVQLSDLPPLEKEVMTAIGTEQMSLDQIALLLHQSVPEIATVLFSLEVKNLLLCENGLYSKKQC